MEILEIIALVILLVIAFSTVIMVKTEREFRKKMDTSFKEMSALNKLLFDDLKEKERGKKDCTDCVTPITIKKLKYAINEAYIKERKENE